MRLRPGYIILIFVITLAVGSLISLLSFEGTAACSLEIVGKEEGLEVEPEGGKVFDVENIAPGMNEGSVVTVRNEGDNDFHLSVSVEKKEGSELLSNGLEIEAAPRGKSLFTAIPLLGLRK